MHRSRRLKVLIAADLPPPEKGRMFTYFIIYVLCIDRFSFPTFISEINFKVQTIMFSHFTVWARMFSAI